MPNWVKTNISIDGSKAEIEKFKEEVINKSKELYNKEFSFNSIIEMPKSLNIESSSIIEHLIAYINGGEKPKFFDELKKEEQDKYINMAKIAIDNIEKYGYKDWYDWSIANWGTKWDVCDVDICEGLDGENLFISFETAWSLAYNVIAKMAETHKELHFVVDYADEDLGINCGSIEFLYGELSRDLVGDYEFACEIWGWEKDELEDVPLF